MEVFLLVLSHFVKTAITLFSIVIGTIALGFVLLMISSAIARRQEIKDIERKEREKNMIRSIGKAKEPIDEKSIQIKKINEETKKEDILKFGFIKRRRRKK